MPYISKENFLKLYYEIYITSLKAQNPEIIINEGTRAEISLMLNRSIEKYMKNKEDPIYFEEILHEDPTVKIQKYLDEEYLERFGKEKYNQYKKIVEKERLKVQENGDL